MRDQVFHVADKSMDPIGIVALFGYMMLRKFTGFELTQDELLYGSMACGAVRILWEQHKRKRMTGGRFGPA